MPLAARPYRALRTSIATILAGAREQAEAALAHALVTAYWHIGQQILEQPTKGTPADRAELMRRLAADLELNVRTLQRALAFHRAYPEPPETALTWAHYRTLTPLPPEHRSYYEQLALQESLSARDLTLAIDSARHEHPDTPHAPEPAPPGKTLRRPTGAGYLYKAALIKVVDGDTLVLDVDLGFRVHAHQRIRLAGLDAPPGNTREGESAKRYVRRTLAAHPHLAVHTRAIDTYGRYIGHVFYTDRNHTLDRIFTHGQHLNQKLLSHNHATPL